MRSLLLMIGLGLAGLLLAGCDPCGGPGGCCGNDDQPPPPPPPPDDTCASNADCVPGAFCNPDGECVAVPMCGDVGCPGTLVCDDRGTCVPPSTLAERTCALDADCLTGQRCCDGVCRLEASDAQGAACCGGPCTPTGVACVCDGDCPGGDCTGGRCHLLCATDAECGSGDVCQDGTCWPDPAPAVECAVGADCGADAVCVNGGCRARCAADADCTHPADFCESGVCLPDWRSVPECTIDEECADGDECRDGRCVAAGCPDGTQKIYLVDDAYHLLSYDPGDPGNPLRLVATLACPAAPSLPDWASGYATPFSMSVDRTGRAWVLYTSGEIFWVDVETGACTLSPFRPGDRGFAYFGMGFAGAEDERLYIAGGPDAASQGAELGWIDPATLEVTRVGPVASSDVGPELTGTRDGRLFGWFPGASSSFVSEIDTATGGSVEGQTWSLDGLGGLVRAWAFATWGSRFHLFVTIEDAATGALDSRVLRLDPATGQLAVVGSLPYVIVGAGVSTCAPVCE